MSDYKESTEKVEMLTAHFAKFDCTYLGLPRFEKKSDLKFRTVRFNSCGHEQDVSYHNSLKKSASGGPKCKQCQINAKQALFDKHGYIVIEKITKDKFLVKKPCGHIAHAYVNHMKTYDNILCSFCIMDRHLEYCEKLGVEYLEQVNAVEAIYKFKCCGATKKLYKVAVERGNCLCPSCGNGWMTKPSKIYLFQLETSDGFNFLKFGYGKDLENRVREYRLKDCKFKSLIYYIDLPSGQIAMREELRIHSELGVTLDSSTMRKYLTRGGYSECYPLDQLDTIVNKMKDVCQVYEKDLDEYKQ